MADAPNFFFSDPQQFKPLALNHPSSDLVEKQSFILAADIFNQLFFNKAKRWDCTTSGSHLDPSWQIKEVCKNII